MRKAIARYLAIGAALVALFVGGAAFGQANGVSTFQTPGNQTVSGYVPLGVSPSGLAGGAGLGNAGYPTGATPIAIIATGTTGAVSANLANAAGKFTYICGFNVSILQAATAANITIQLTNGVGGVGSPTQDSVLTWQLTLPISVVTNFSQNFSPCLPAAAANAPIAVATSADATATTVDVNAWGYQQ